MGELTDEKEYLVSFLSSTAEADAFSNETLNSLLELSLLDGFPIESIVKLLNDRGGCAECCEGREDRDICLIISNWSQERSEMQLTIPFFHEANEQTHEEST